MCIAKNANKLFTNSFPNGKLKRLLEISIMKTYMMYMATEVNQAKHAKKTAEI